MMFGGIMMTEGSGSVSRRRFIQGAGVAASAAAVTRAGITPAEAEETRVSSFTPRGKLRQQPNILLILCDEYRFPVAYESSQLQRFRSRYLTAEEALRDNGLEFTNHYIMTTACVPSRNSIFTGQYPSLHGSSQTPGAAKTNIEMDMYWLDPNTLPTMGNYFRAGGYDTYYKGKWHVSEADIHIPGTYDQLLTFNKKGEPEPKAEEAYLAADRLGPYGFSGWIGPEPHGSNPLNSGSSAADAIGRDQKFATQAVDLLNELAKRGGRSRPWLLVNSYVNVHDITVWGTFTLQSPDWNLTGQLENSKVPYELFNPAEYAATSHENLSGKPECQQDYVDKYPQIFQPVPQPESYRRFYYQLQQNVNEQIQRVLNTLNAHPQMAQNTIVIFTSDHGELLGAHGGMHQKWHSMYEEATHVPFIVHNPRLFAGRESLDEITSHADLLPTMLGLAGLNPAKLGKELAKTHTEVHPLVGRDLSAVILGEPNAPAVKGPVYFLTEDEVSRGSDQVGTLGFTYESVIQPNTVESIVTYLPTGDGGAQEKWKYARYSDNPQFWTDPAPPNNGEPKDVLTHVDGNVNRPGRKRALTTVKTEAAADQTEAYNVTKDPLELTNLVHSTDPSVQATIKHLEKLLHQQCEAKMLKPGSGKVPGQPAC
jgi:choline-sulfatase